MKDDRLIELAIHGLEAQRERINSELTHLQERIRGASKVLKQLSAPAAATKKSGRKKMSPAKRKALSAKMKASWAARKKAAK